MDEAYIQLMDALRHNRELREEQQTHRTMMLAVNRENERLQQRVVELEQAIERTTLRPGVAGDDGGNGVSEVPPSPDETP